MTLVDLNNKAMASYETLQAVLWFTEAISKPVLHRLTSGAVVTVR